MADDKRTFFDDLKFSNALRPAQDKVYHMIYPNLKSINRTNGNILDKKMHIDVILQMKNGIRVTAQEKVLKHEEIGWNNFTVEYLQDRETGEEGEMFNLFAQLYLTGYLNASNTDYENWYVIDVARFMNYLANCPRPFLDSCTKAVKTSKAKLFEIDFNSIPDDCIIACHDGNKQKLPEVKGYLEHQFGDNGGEW